MLLSSSFYQIDFNKNKNKKTRPIARNSTDRAIPKTQPMQQSKHNATWDAAHAVICGIESCDDDEFEHMWSSTLRP